MKIPLKTLGAVFVVLMSVAVVSLAQQPQTVQPADQPAARFAAVDVHLDSGPTPLAAYQFELTAETGEFSIVGIEGGEHPAFAKPPYYDPAALSRDRVIIAAFHIGPDLPAGKTRVARVHVRAVGPEEPDYIVNLEVAASADGTEIPVTASITQGHTM